MDKIAGKVIWITGASSGIGEALAYAFAERGAVLVLSARRESELVRVEQNCKGAKAVKILPLDVSQIEQLPGKVQWVLAEMGTIDFLVLCAGVSQRSVAINTAPEVYRRIMEINYFGTVALSLAVLPHFIKNNSGQFVVMSSVTGKVGLPLRTAYSGSKHALEGFFSALKTEVWRTGVKILMVRAGAVKTNISINALTGDGENFNQKDPIIENGISAEKCAKSIVQAVVAGKEVVVVGSFKEKLLFVINRFFPSLAFNLVKRLGEKN